MADDRSIRVRLLAEIGNYRQAMQQASAATAEFGKNVSGHGTAVKKDIQGISRAALLMSAGIGLAVGASIKAAVDWETAWAGVTKTVSGSASEMNDLEDGLRGLARELPASHKEIAAVAEAAGQLGIQRSAIVDFTDTMIALGVSTNLTADQAATGIAQIANVMGTSQGDIDRFGATLVALGNVGASTESEILEMSKRLAGAGKLVGASESDVLALANAMSSMGIEAQLGGGAFSRVMLKIYSAVKSGGAALGSFADIAGTSAQQFAADFESDPIRAVDSFIQGLNDIDKSGGNVIARLGEVGIKGTQDLQVLLRLKGAGDLLKDSLNLGSKAWQDNIALQNEAQKRYDTTASKLKVLRNNIGDVAIDIGGTFLPATKAATDGIGSMVAGFAELGGAGRTVVTGLGLAIGGVTGFIGLLGTVGPKVKEFQKSLENMGALGKGLSNNLGLIGTGLGVAGLALGVYTYLLGENAKAQAEAAKVAGDYADAIEQQGTMIGRTTDEMALKAVLDGKVGDSIRKAGIDLGDFLDALHATGPEARDMRDALIHLATATADPLAKGWSGFFQVINDGTISAIPGLKQALLDLQASGDVSPGQMAEIVSRIALQNQGLAEGAEQFKNRSAAEKTAAEAADKVTTADKKAEQAAKERAEAVQGVTDAIKDMVDAERAAVNPLFAMLDATLANKDANKELIKTMGDSASTADDVTKAQAAAAKSALDVNAAAIELSNSVAAGNVNIDVAKGMLQEWVDQGLIAQGTASSLATQFDTATTNADKLAVNRQINFQTTGLDTLETTLDRLLVKLNQQGMFAAVEREARGAAATVGAKPAPVGSAQGYHGAYDHASGGFAGTSGLVSTGPTGSDTIPAYLGPGEFVINATSARLIGARTLARLNSVSPGSGYRSVASPSIRAWGSGGGSTGDTYVINVAGSVHSERSLQRAVEKGVRTAVRKGGGNVQRYLGPDK